jgi:hypothetical protein
MTPRRYARLEATQLDLEMRLKRAERMNRRLAAMHGLTIEELEAEESSGVRFGYPHTWGEHQAWLRLNEVDDAS